MCKTKAVRFGEFEFDEIRHELRRSGLRVRLSASQLRLLTIFVERPGELITRDEIAARLWTNPQSVDVSTGINTAVNRLRWHLSDNSSEPVFIKTVIGVGYRFIAEIEAAHEGEPEAEVLSEDVAEPEPANLAPAPETQHKVVEMLPANAAKARSNVRWIAAAVFLVLMGAGALSSGQMIHFFAKSHAIKSAAKVVKDIRLHVVARR